MKNIYNILKKLIATLTVIKQKTHLVWPSAMVTMAWI